MATVAADHERAEHAINLEERELVPAAAVCLLVAASRVDLGVFMNNLAGR